MVNVLVTGGAGYLGVSVVKELLRTTSYTPIIYDSFITGSKRELLSRSTSIEGDVRDLGRLIHIMQDYNIEAVVHVSSMFDVPDSVKNPMQYYSSNVHGMICVLKAMEECNIKKLVFSSGASVYGNAKTDGAISENSALNAISPCGSSLKMMEKMIYDYANTKDSFRYVTLRLFNICGADVSSKIGWYKNKSTNVIPTLLKDIDEGKKFKINGIDYNTYDGTCVRDYVHVSDVAIAEAKALEYLFNDGKNITINIGSGEPVSVLDVFRKYELLIESDIEYVISSRREGDAEHIVANTKLAEKVLRWSAKSDLESILRGSSLWYKSYFSG